MAARLEKQPEVSENEREIAALTREGEHYKINGMVNQVALVNEQLRLRGGAEIDLPKAPQRRDSTQAATRKKRTAS